MYTTTSGASPSWFVVYVNSHSPIEVRRNKY